MGTEYLIDTNVIIGYLDNKIPTAGMEFISSVVDETPVIPIISKIELLRFDKTIAATCITYDLTLLTRNTGDFKGIAHLKILNPWEMTDAG